jgi:uncharacterized protein (TIGR03435 family)
MTIRTISALVVFCSTVLAQSPRFEAADVHRSVSAPNPYTWASGGILRGARYDLRKATMIDLIHAAWDVDPELIVGGPDWLEFNRFDVAAKADAATPPATVRLMLQNLLADRFHLVVHKDTRPFPVYRLAAGKTKPKLRDADGTGLPNADGRSSPVAFFTKTATT